MCQLMKDGMNGRKVSPEDLGLHFVIPTRGYREGCSTNFSGFLRKGGNMNIFFSSNANKDTVRP